MGKVAILVVLGLVIAFAFLGYFGSQANVGSVSNMTGYFKYTYARNIAHTAVNIALHGLEIGNDTTRFSGSVMSGTYNVNIVFTGDTLDMTSRGRYVDTAYTIVLRLKRYAKPFPDVQAGVMLAVDSVNFSMQGSASIDGRNHDINGALQSDSTDKAGVLTLSSHDSTTVAAYSGKINGSPKVKVDPDMSNPLNYVNEYIANADYSYGAGVYGSNMTWGSANAPVIVICDAGTGTVKFTGTIEGWGILVVKGNLTLAGTFKFHGLVLVYQDSEIDDQVTTDVGTPRVIGAIIMTGGAGSSFRMKGNGAFLYSWEAIDKAQHMKKLLAYTILRWYE
jgi:hypothetical protein